MAFSPVEDQISNTDVCAQSTLCKAAARQKAQPGKKNKKIEEKKKKGERESPTDFIIMNFTLKHHPERRHT